MNESSVDAVTLSKDCVFDLLRDEYRRAVLRHLESNGRRASLGELVGAVDRETNGDADETRHDRIGVQLHQIHLPKLATAGVLWYDSTEKTAELLDEFPRLFGHLHFDVDVA